MCIGAHRAKPELLERVENIVENSELDRIL